MKKLILLLFALVMVLPVKALDFTVDNLKYSPNSDGNTCTLTGFVNKPTDKLVIPETVSDGSVTYFVSKIG